MNMGYYEKIHRATISEPYIDNNLVNLNFTSHFHEEIEIIYVIEGSIKICVDGKNYNANSGVIGIIMPGQIHSYSSVKNISYLMKIIPPNCSTEIHFPLIRLKNSLLTKDFGDTYKKMQKLILGLFSEYEDKKLGYKISIMKDSLQILLSIIRNLEYETISPERNHKIYKKMSFMKAVNKYIENNFTNKITLSDISEHCGYSLYYFAHFFKETTNRSFFDYLSDFRAEKARQLILISDKKLIDIAFLCGFNNLTSFNRVFKKNFNISPSEYRKIVTG